MLEMIRWSFGIEDGKLGITKEEDSKSSCLEQFAGVLIVRESGRNDEPESSSKNVKQ